jgi:hypothetical protein
MVHLSLPLETVPRRTTMTKEKSHSYNVKVTPPAMTIGSIILAPGVKQIQDGPPRASIVSRQAEDSRINIPCVLTSSAPVKTKPGTYIYIHIYSPSTRAHTHTDTHICRYDSPCDTVRGCRQHHEEPLCACVTSKV